MNIVIFGLSVTSAWGNGHATLLRGLFRSLHERGHKIHFFERDTLYYAAHRDAPTLPYADVHLYRDWAEVEPLARRILRDADVGMATSYCPDGHAACELILNARLPRTIFYDMDTPVTLARIDRGEIVEYIPREGLVDFDLVLSYTGGPTLEALQNTLGARRVAPLYGWVDPVIHSRTQPDARFAAQLAYLGTYAADRQPALDSYLLNPARLLPQQQFLIAGAMYPDQHLWPQNVRFMEHVAPPDHSAFYSSSPLMLSVTRASMAANGFCPSGRLFESAACGTAVLTDWWDGLDTFFTPGEEILVTTSTEDALRALSSDRAYLQQVGERARERALDCHTASIRAQLLESLIEATPAFAPSLAAVGVPL